MENATNQSLLPDYTNPPVVETILGVQFDRLPNFRNTHAGAFWTTYLRDQWPVLIDAPPLESQLERFDEAGQWPQFVMQLAIAQEFPARLQFKTRKSDQMIQVQNDRLFFNWLGQDGGSYPRYESVRAGFNCALDQFTAFVAQEQLGMFRPIQWEVTYLNQIPKGTVWNTVEDWRFFKPLGAVPTIGGLIEGESFAGNWHFVIPGKRGRLHVQWQHGKRAIPTPKEAIVLTLTARGPVPAVEASGATKAVLDSLDLGHNTIVRAFPKLMSDDANKYWGLKNAD